MKKTFVQTAGIFACGLLLATTAQAQIRQTNLQVQLVSPTANQVYNFGDTVKLSFTLKNNGPDVLRAGDTLVFSHSLSQNPAAILVGQLTNNADLASGATTPAAIIAQAKNNNTTGSDQTASICIVALNINTAGLTINGNPFNVTWNDSDTANNRSCATATLKKQPTSGIFETGSGYAALVLSPNPAQDKVSFTLDLDKPGQVTLYIRDIQGREVIRRDYGKAAAGAGKHFDLDLTSLKSGMYFAELSAGERQFKGKLSVQR